MNKDDLRELLAQPYQFNNWKKVVDFVFPNVSYLKTPLTIPTEANLVESFRQVGSVRMNDGKNLALFEVRVKPNVNIARNRVALRNLVAGYIDQERNHGILAIYEKGTDEYRFTYTAKETDYDEENGDFIQRETATKRFTYILGANETCRTARDRFWELSQHKEEATIQDVENAFSIEKLSKEFFIKYKSQYTSFVDYLTNSNFKISAFNGNEKAIRDFVKKMLGRIVFLHFVQKKSWLGASNTDYQDGDKQFMNNFWISSGKDQAFYAAHLTRLFFDALNQSNRKNDTFEMPDGKIVCVPPLGGGLFEKDREDPEWLTFPPALFENLFSFFSEYNFTIDENDQHENEVGIDPEMLGQIFENLLEDNKDKGAFYTPKIIVKFMCHESLIQYLLSTFEKEGIVTDVNQKAEFENRLCNLVLKLEANDLIEYDRLLAQALHCVKICDPAIGSGAFPMGILNEMVMLINILHNASPDVVEDIWKMDDWQPSTVKKHIIQNSIYGVDIEKGAVDVARLRFWLSLIIDEEKPCTLPSLDYKIVIGDSLISKFEDEVIDINWEVKDATQTNLWGNDAEKEKQEILQKITQKQQVFFASNNHQKEKLSLEIRFLKIDLLIKQLEIQIKTIGLETEPSGRSKAIKKQTELYLKTQGWQQTINQLRILQRHPNRPFFHFDWKLDFPEVLNPEVVNGNCGFDIVIGNPPYIQLQKLGKYADILQKAEYETFIRTGDIYGLFYELGSKLLKENGILTFITSNKWMRAGYGITLRKFFTEKANPLKLVDFGGFQVFETATVDTNILILQKSVNQHQTETCVLNRNYNRRTNLSVYFRQNQTIATNYSAEVGWVITSSLEAGIREKIQRQGIPLKDWDIKIYRGILTGFNEAFIIDNETKNKLIESSPKNAEIIRPILFGENIKRFSYVWRNSWLINSHNGLKGIGIPRINIEGDYPTIYEHFLKHRDRLEKRYDKGDHWTNLRNCTYQDSFYVPKIIYPEITKFITFYFDESEHLFVNNKCFILTGNCLEYLTCFLNSSLFRYCFLNNFPELLGGTRELRKIFFLEIPVKIISDDSNNSYREILLRIKEKSNEPNIVTELVECINQKILKEYCLSALEIRLINEFNQRWLNS